MPFMSVYGATETEPLDDSTTTPFCGGDLFRAGRFCLWHKLEEVSIFDSVRDRHDYFDRERRSVTNASTSVRPSVPDGAGTWSTCFRRPTDDGWHSVALAALSPAREFPTPRGRLKSGMCSSPVGR